MAKLRRTVVYLVCGGKYHDFDYVRLELLKLLYPLPGVRTLVAADYSDTAAILAADVLISYTTDVIPDESQQDALAAFLSAGKRWFALHGSNAAISIDESGYASSPRVAPRFMEMLGSQFIAHPEKGPFEVHNAAPDHPLTEGIGTFTVDDELYLLEMHGEVEVLLYAHFNGQAMRGFTEREFRSDEKRPILYLRTWNTGQVLYLNLGHCRSHFDMEPLMNWYPDMERGSWDSPVFRTLLGRCIDWSLGQPEVRA